MIGLFDTSDNIDTSGNSNDILALKFYIYINKKISLKLNLSHLIGLKKKLTE